MNNLKTIGKEFLLNGEPYSGFYNELTTNNQTQYFTKRAFDKDESERLTKILEIIKEYNSISGIRIGDAPELMTPTPTANDYKRQWIYRYFAKRKNNINATIVEIDQIQYDKFRNEDVSVNHPIYQVIRIRWKISGPMFDKIDVNGILIEPGVVDTNNRTISAANIEMYGIRNRLKHNIMQYSTKDKDFEIAYMNTPSLSRGRKITEQALDF